MNWYCVCGHEQTPPPPSQTGDPLCTLFVGRLSYTATAADLGRAVASAGLGTVLGVTITRDPATQHSRCPPPTNCTQL